MELLLSLPRPPPPAPELGVLAGVDHVGYGPLHHACVGGSVQVVEVRAGGGGEG